MLIKQIVKDEKFNLYSPILYIQDQYQAHQSCILSTIHSLAIPAIVVPFSSVKGCQAS
jgi:hypothetical protein